MLVQYIVNSESFNCDKIYGVIHHMKIRPFVATKQYIIKLTHSKCVNLQEDF